MRHLLRYQSLWNDPDHLTVCTEYGIGHGSHEPHPCATVDQTHPTSGKGATQLVGNGAIARSTTGTRSTEHADTLHKREAVLITRIATSA